MQNFKVLLDSSNWICLSNFINCSRLYNYFTKNGHIITTDPSEADYIIINACGAVVGLENYSFRLYNQYYSQKKKSAKVIMFGCLAKIREEILKEMDLIAIELFDSEKLDKIFLRKFKFADFKYYSNEDTKNKLLKNKKIDRSNDVLSILFPITFYSISKKFRSKIIGTVKDSRGLIQISFGCIGNCSYCIIKKAKGKARSVKMEEILSNIEDLRKTTKNLVIVSEDCGCYGVDTKSTFTELLNKIQARFPDINIYLSFIDPLWLQKNPDEYLKLFKEVKIKAVMISLQSGSNKIIKRMNRHYDVNQILKIVKQIKKISPDTLLYSQGIIGFPGETTVDFLKTIFAFLHYDFTFFNMYSDIKGTESYLLDGKKSSFTKIYRASIYGFVSLFITSFKFFIKKELLINHIFYRYWQPNIFFTSLSEKN